MFVCVIIVLWQNLTLMGARLQKKFKKFKKFSFFGSNLLTCAARSDIVIMGMRDLKLKFASTPLY